MSTVRSVAESWSLNETMYRALCPAVSTSESSAKSSYSYHSSCVSTIFSGRAELSAAFRTIMISDFSTIMIQYDYVPPKIHFSFSVLIKIPLARRTPPSPTLIQTRFIPRDPTPVKPPWSLPDVRDFALLSTMTAHR